VLIEFDAFTRQAVDVRRSDRGTVVSHIGPPHVVGDDTWSMSNPRAFKPACAR
jgi:hypothetical protein